MHMAAVDNGSPKARKPAASRETVEV
jgi:hypothetical protein